MEPGEGAIAMDSKMDDLLRRSLAAPIPTISANFEQHLLRQVDRSSQPLDRYRRIMFAGYGLASIATCAVVMRSQGLPWIATALLIFAPLAALAALRSRPGVRHRIN
jgi:hypothetical protein